MIKAIPAPAGNVSFHFLKPVTLSNRKSLKQFLLEMCLKETRLAAELSYVFCSDRHLLGMNRKFLSHNYLTDILTFPLDGLPGQLSGEMYLSIDRIRDNARTLYEPVGMELHRVIFHGALHLCGYKDKSPGQMKEMRAKEDYYLQKYFS